jgi:hypothetical protein
MRRRPGGRPCAALTLEARVLPSSTVGDEIRVDAPDDSQSTTHGISRSNATRADGGFVVTWEHVPIEGPNPDIMARLFNPDGTPATPEFLVNTSRATHQFAPSVGMNASGDFVIVWESVVDGGWSIFGQRYNAAGVAQGDEFLVNDDSPGRRQYAKVALDDAGNFTVTWSAFTNDSNVNPLGVYARQFDSAGVPLEDEFRVDSISDVGRNSDIAMEPNGEFVIVWTRSGSFFGEIYGRRYNAAGSALGTEFPISSGMSAAGANVAVDADGDFVVAWMGSESGLDHEIFVRTFGSDGTALTDQDQVNTGTDGIQWYPSVSASAEGHFVIAWTRNANGIWAEDMYARVYIADFGAAGDEFLVNPPSTGGQTYGHVAMTPDGKFVISWTKNTYQGIYAQRYSIDPIALSGHTVSENAPAGAVVGSFSTIDLIDGAYTYELVSGAGSTDNMLFQIVGNELRTLGPFNFEAKSSYSVRVRSTHELGQQLEWKFTIEVTDVDEFNVGPITDTNLASSTIPEHSPSGTPVGITAFAQDQDGSNNQITYSLWNTRGGRFAIDPVTGVVTVDNGAILDREVQASWTITVLATSQDGSVSVKDFTVDLADVNEFKVGKVFDLNSAPDTVIENAPDGTAVGITGFGIDLDATNSAVTYSLWNTRGGRFAINPTTGVVTVANGSLLDREVQGTWTITVLATSQDGSISVRDFTITLQDVDEFNVGQVFDLDPATNSVAENATNGTNVGITGFGIDLDATNSAVTYSLTENAGGRFAIHPTTGVVTVANGNLLDREAASSWGISIKATSSDGSSSTKIFSIGLIDANDFEVGDVTDINVAADAVVENAPAGTLVGIRARAVDGDVTGQVTYSLADNAEDRFQIDPATGAVSVAPGAVIDFETDTSFEIKVLATSNDGSTSSAVFTIDVTNVNDKPRITVSEDTVDEGLPAATVVGTLGTADIDVTSPVYTLVSGTGGTDNSRFSIVGTELRTRYLFNFETKSSYSIRVKMRDVDGTVINQVLIIKVGNVNEKPTGLTLSPATIAENNAIGATVGLLSGVDPDIADALNYTLVAGSGSADNSRFTIEGNQLKAKAVFDYETKRSYSIRVRVTDADGLTYEKTLTVKISNAAD